MAAVTGTAPPVYASHDASISKVAGKGKGCCELYYFLEAHMAEKVGSSIVTYRLKLRCDHIDWIQETENLYNKNGLIYFKGNDSVRI